MLSFLSKYKKHHCKPHINWIYTCYVIVCSTTVTNLHIWKQRLLMHKHLALKSYDHKTDWWKLSQALYCKMSMNCTMYCILKHRHANTFNLPISIFTHTVLTNTSYSPWRRWLHSKPDLSYYTRQPTAV